MINKVVYGGTTLIDITDTTATASDVASGKYFYLANGSRVQGTSSGGAVDIHQDAQGYLVLGKDGEGGGGSVSPCPITLYANTTSGVSQYFFASVQMTASDNYCRLVKLYSYIASSPLSCYALPRYDTSGEYPYMIAVYSNYNNFRVYLNSSSTNCIALYSTSSSPYEVAIGCKPNAVVILNYENMN